MMDNRYTIILYAYFRKLLLKISLISRIDCEQDLETNYPRGLCFDVEKRINHLNLYCTKGNLFKIQFQFMQVRLIHRERILEKCR